MSKRTVMSLCVIITLVFGYIYSDIKSRQDIFDGQFYAAKKDPCKALNLMLIASGGDPDTIIEAFSRQIISGEQWREVTGYNKYAERKALEWSIHDLCFSGY